MSSGTAKRQQPSEQAACADIAARGGENGQIATRILRISREMEALIAGADAFLGQYRRSPHDLRLD